ncbi:MAG: 5-formyltetrahydrofolate cyclo-ligase [Verrucomicrobiota bacterium]|nr:5-formyltetrahydrofolate cyclo-ligase [Verrucomicrobiota bacterium]
MIPLQDQKRDLRFRLRQELAKISDAEKRSSSARLLVQLQNFSRWKDSGTLLLFAPREDEPDILPLIPESLSLGKRVTLPRYNQSKGIYEAAEVKSLEELQVGSYGIREPSASAEMVALNRLDLVLIPGLGFDLHGHRLGRGRGFYDRLLAGLPGIKCGVAFDQQVISKLPIEPHDVILNSLVTPSRSLEFTQNVA